MERLRKTLSYLCTLILLTLSSPSLAESPQNSIIESFRAASEHLSVTLLSEELAVTPNSTLLLGLHFEIIPNWHIYWKNPGDSGAELIMDWTPNSGSVAETLWPYPERISIGDLTNYGYHDEVLIPVRFETRDLIGDYFQVDLELEWLVCEIECVPGFASLSLMLPWAQDGVSYESPEQEDIRALFREYISQVPMFSTDLGVTWVEDEGTHLKFKLSHRDLDLSQFDAAHLFPKDPMVFSTQAAEVFPDGQDLIIRAPFDTNRPQDVDRADFVLTVHSPEEVYAFEVHVKREFRLSGLTYVLFLAFLGGIILNLMPCVLPVLSLKAMSFIKDQQGGLEQAVRVQSEIRVSSLFYTLGILVSFTLLGATLVFLRSTGEMIGWGFQLQSPGIVFFLSFLFFILGLYFIGLIGFSDERLMQLLNKLGFSKISSNMSSTSGSFGTGVLAVIVASPCTAPFMGAALGAALVYPATIALMIFFFLGLGLAFPLLLISYVPSVSRVLPKPGNWMIRLKEFFAFPMWATSVWLLWVLGLQVGPTFVVYVVSFFVLILFFIWLSQIVAGLRWLLVLASALVFLGSFKILPRLQMLPGLGTAEIKSVWLEYDKDLVNSYREEGRPVFIDFTAAWCITCQWNKRSVLQTEAIQNYFSENNFVLFEADWTSRDEKITEALNSYGRNSVPVYVFYGLNAEAKLLPELLTRDMITSLTVE